MKRNQLKAKPLYAILSWAVMILVIVISAMISSGEDTKFSSYSNLIMIQEATISGIGAVNTPYRVQLAKGDETTISVILPEEIHGDMALCYMTGYCVTSVEVEGREIYSYGSTMPLPYGSMLGNIRAIAPITEEDAGKTATIHLVPIYGMVWTLSEFFVGSRSDIFYYIIMRNLWRLIAVTFFATILLLSIAIGAHHFVHRRTDFARMYMCLTGFIFCIITWVLCNSDLMQFFTNNNAVVALTSFLALAAMGPAFIGYCYYAMPRGKSAFFWTGTIGLVLPFINCVLYVTNVLDPVYLMYATHVYILGGLCLCFVNGIRSWKNHDSRNLIVAVLALALCGGIALFEFYQDQMGMLPALILTIGMGFFSLDLFVMLLMKEERMIGEQMISNVYREMAYKDYLTGSGNRAAFEKELEKSETNGASRVSVIMLDLNRLKTTNDELGHQAGDEMIRAITNCIESTFEPKGHCYRLGGDEFATILWDCDCMVDDYIEKLMKKIEEYNAEHIIQLSVAVGYANADNPKSRDGFQKIYSAADKNMYFNKIQCHEQMDAQTEQKRKEEEDGV